MPAAIVACVLLVAIPVLLFTGIVSFAWGYPLAIAWVFAWIVSMCAAEAA